MGGQRIPKYKPVEHEISFKSGNQVCEAVIDIYHNTIHTKNDGYDLAHWFKFYCNEFTLNTDLTNIESFILYNSIFNIKTKYDSDKNFNNVAIIEPEPIKDYIDKKTKLQSKITQNWIITLNYDEIKTLVDQIDETEIIHFILDKYTKLLDHKLYYFFSTKDSLFNLDPTNIQNILDNIDHYKKETGFESAQEIEIDTYIQIGKTMRGVKDKKITQKNKKRTDMLVSIMRWDHLQNPEYIHSILSNINTKMENINKINSLGINYIIDNELNSPEGGKTPDIVIQYLNEIKEKIETSNEYNDILTIYEPKIKDIKEKLESFIEGINLFSESTKN